MYIAAVVLGASGDRIMKFLVSFTLFLPSIAFAADDADQETFLFAALVAGAVAVYVLFIKPEQFRERIRKRLPKYEKYVGRIRQNSDHAKALSDDEIWQLVIYLRSMTDH